MRRGYTLIEIIITVAITGILSVGMFKAFEAITTRSEKAKILSSLSIDSQSALDQISLLLYNRAPMSMQGCDIAGNCESLDGSLYTKNILKWYGTASESYQAEDYSGFVDMNASVTSKPILQSPDTNLSKVLTTERSKWNNTFTLSDMGLVFSGTFEDGISPTPNLFKSTNDKIEFLNTTNIPSINERYYLIDSAYAVVRGEHLPNQTATCINNLGKLKDINNTLFLFYNYRPWKTPLESFCADIASNNPLGQVTILATNVNAFAAHQLNGTIRLGIDMNSSVGNNKINPIRLSKQKVVF